MKHVLIMDDNALLAYDWRDAFELDGHQVTLSHSGEDAIVQIESTNFDLIITDMFVPNRKGGFHVIGKLMSMNRSTPPTIAVTGERRHKDGPDDENFFLKLGKSLNCYAAMEKPFTPEALVSKAHELWDSQS